MSSKTALIVVDIQNDHFPGGLWTLSKADPAYGAGVARALGL
ncbi:hypothetical protein SAMN03159511_0287 [Pseudomonas sp. NFACC19-2]|nr:hypothetical protein [Pseudomonas sp. NFACC19-2]SFW61736.1 hypothetical protein SAMN03159511_0287 [Pseudomonas sp. NFACC19-2]